MRLAFVVQRYGAQVAGGAEALCRATARSLATRGHELVVHTTTARDYLTWAPHYPEGRTLEDGVEVRRHAVDPPRPDRAAALVRRLGLAPGDAALEREWALAQGPVAPTLLREIAADRRAEAVVFWTYLYATTQLGLPLAGERGMLVPLAHDEPMLRFAVTRGVVATARGLAFLTPEERRLVDDLHRVGQRPSAVVGAGLEHAPIGDAARARARFRPPPRFALYLGRVDAAKGVAALIRAHGRYRAAGGRLGLVLAGRASGRLALPRWATATGFVSEPERADLLAAAEVVVLPSPYESLSLVALEAWQAARPTLGNARSEVVAGQTARSGGGALYDSVDAYVRRLRLLEGDAELRRRLGARGAAWVAPQTWDACAARWEDLLERVAARSAASGQ